MGFYSPHFSLLSLSLVRVHGDNHSKDCELLSCIFGLGGKIKDQKQRRYLNIIQKRVRFRDDQYREN